MISTFYFAKRVERSGEDFARLLQARLSRNVSKRTIGVMEKIGKNNCIKNQLLVKPKILS